MTDVHHIGAPSPATRATLRSLHHLRVVGWLEGLSYVLLLGVAMPLKYLAGLPEAVRVVGWAHGVLFVVFIAALIHATVRTRWPLTRVAGAFVTSLVPFGMVMLDRWLRLDAQTITTSDRGRWR